MTAEEFLKRVEFAAIIPGNEVQVEVMPGRFAGVSDVYCDATGHVTIELKWRDKDKE